MNKASVEPSVTDRVVVDDVCRESVLWPEDRRLRELVLHYWRNAGDTTLERLVDELTALTRPWNEDFRLILTRRTGKDHAHALYRRYRYALSEGYKDEHTPDEAAEDVATFELLHQEGQVETRLYRRRGQDQELRFKVYRYGQPMLLSEMLPMLHSFGVIVADERPYEIRLPEATIFLYDCGLRMPQDARPLEQIRVHVHNAFSAIWNREAESDELNALVLTCGLTWRQVMVLRAYTAYLRLTNPAYRVDCLMAVLRAHGDIAVALIALFEARFDPGVTDEGGTRQVRIAEVMSEVMWRIDGVASLDEDRIFRSYLTMINATTRTSAFRSDPHTGRPDSSIAIKYDPQKIDWLVAPRPRCEVYVYAPEYEGIHVRFGAIARGGLRWSHRREDIRTEILGLAKAQVVKNAVIVPTGAKGGFVLKGDDSLDQAKLCYQRFISALLDVTDNSVHDTVVPPAQVIRYDDDDPYLVVAADKGTATFSDLANEIAVRRGFWLADAFASGGSTGYDHKAMGITARGVWESVRWAFQKLHVDTANITVVGIGDMSGDVFGNGMLASSSVTLIAAFDHRHIFIDPTPDAEGSFQERSRLFSLPGSCWDDYNRELISDGGGVWPRSAKSIPIIQSVRVALGLSEDTPDTLSPDALIPLILQAPVDLLFNGGIGTYVKAVGENNANVGDAHNDTIRIHGRQLRCAVVAEGGNLGLTQQGRVEYALNGGHITTDFIDNSAGVNCSDREVTIKIMLERAIMTGRLGRDQRNSLLSSMSDDVAALVLQDNRDQAIALGVAQTQAAISLPTHRRMIDHYEHCGHIDRIINDLPTDKTLAERETEGTGLCLPELAVLGALTKNLIKREVLCSPLPDEPWTDQVLLDYFPEILRRRFAETIAEHPLRREIVATRLVNEAINWGGICLFFRLAEETGHTAADLVRVYGIVRKTLSLPPSWGHADEVKVHASSAHHINRRLLLQREFERGIRSLTFSH